MNNIFSGGAIVSFVKVLRQGVITIPKEFRVTLNINEGQILEAELLDGKCLVLKPKTLIDSEAPLSTKKKKSPKKKSFIKEGSPLSSKGKRKIKKALEDHKKGRVSKTYDDVNGLIKDLDS